jgi:hypothetical protein
LDVEDGIRFQSFEVKPDLAEPDYSKVVRAGVSHSNIKPTIANIKNARSRISDRHHYEYNNVERRRADRSRVDRQVVDRTVEKDDLQRQREEAQHLAKADLYAYELDAKHAVSKKQQTLDHGKKRRRDVVKGKRVVKRKYAKLKDRSSEFLPVPSGGAQHHPDAYIAALDKLEAQTKANMDVESREHRASVLRTAPSRIARITEEMPGLLARQLAGQTSRDADEMHTQWCRYLNRALNSGDDLGLTDEETKEARALLVGFMPPKRKRKLSDAAEAVAELL